jgi:hypothetical protein
MMEGSHAAAAAVHACCTWPSFPLQWDVVPGFEENLPPWIESTKAEWERLEQDGSACAQLTPASFGPAVLWGAVSELLAVIVLGSSA